MAVGQQLQDRFDKVMAARQAAAVKSAEPKPEPNSTNTYKGSGIKVKPLKYKTDGNAGKKAAPTRSNSKSTIGQDIVNHANKLLGRS